MDRCSRLRFSWCPTMSLYRFEAQPTPPSRKANLSVGNLRVTPPRNRPLQIASQAEAKAPMWL